MAFGPDGSLYVAESGPPGNVTVPLPVNFGGSGPDRKARARSRRSPDGGGGSQQFVTGLPNIGLYGGVEMLGAAAVTFYKGQLYEVAAGHMTVSPKLSRIDAGRQARSRSPTSASSTTTTRRRRRTATPSRSGTRSTWSRSGEALHQRRQLQPRCSRPTPATGELRILATFYPDPSTVGMAVAPDRKEIYVAQYGNAPYLPGSGTSTRSRRTGKVTEGGHGPDDADRHGVREGRDDVRAPVRREVRLEAPPLRRQHRAGCSGSARTARRPARDAPDVPDGDDVRPGRRDLHLGLRQRVELRRGRHPARRPRRHDRRRAGRAAAERPRHLRHPEVERDVRSGRERRGRGEGRHRRAEAVLQVGLLAQGDPREGRPEDRLHEHRADLAHGDLEDGRVRHGPDQAQPVGDRRPEQARLVRAHLHAAPVDEGDDYRQRQVGRRIAGGGGPGRQGEVALARPDRGRARRRRDHRRRLRPRLVRPPPDRRQ